mgnify:CR=1 FL=1
MGCWSSNGGLYSLVLLASDRVNPTHPRFQGVWARLEELIQGVVCMPLWKFVSTVLATSEHLDLVVSFDQTVLSFRASGVMDVAFHADTRVLQAR